MNRKEFAEHVGRKLGVSPEGVLAVHDETWVSWRELLLAGHTIRIRGVMDVVPHQTKRRQIKTPFMTGDAKSIPPRILPTVRFSRAFREGMRVRG